MDTFLMICGDIVILISCIWLFTAIDSKSIIRSIMTITGFLAAIILFVISGRIHTDSVKADIDRYKKAVSEGYEVYIDGSRIDGSKLIMDTRTYDRYVLKYNAKDRTILITQKDMRR